MHRSTRESESETEEITAHTNEPATARHTKMIDNTFGITQEHDHDHNRQRFEGQYWEAAHSGIVETRTFKEERAVSRNGLVFDDVCISEHQDTWHIL